MAFQFTLLPNGTPTNNEPAHRTRERGREIERERERERDTAGIEGARCTVHLAEGTGAKAGGAEGSGQKRTNVATSALPVNNFQSGIKNIWHTSDWIDFYRELILGHCAIERSQLFRLKVVIWADIGQ